MISGVATTLIKHSSLTGKLRREYLVLEVDERSLPGILKLLPCRHMGITNLQKDQAQRNGDPDFIVRKFRSCIGPDMTLYLNNEEPRSKALEDQGGRCVYYSLAPNGRSESRSGEYAVTMPCPRCGHPIAYEYYNLSSVGRFSCRHCGFASGDSPDVLVEQVDVPAGTIRCGGRDYPVSYTEPCYVYNYAMILAICRDLGLTEEEIQRGFGSFVNPAARARTQFYQGKEVHFLQCKQENPEATQSLLDMVAQDPRPKALMIGLYEIEDFMPFFAGSFYLFDCDLDPVVNRNVTEYVAFSRTVSYDIANRLRYAGADMDKLTILDTDDIPAILSALAACTPDVVYVLTEIDHFKAFGAYLKEHGGTKDG